MSLAADIDEARRIAVQKYLTAARGNVAQAAKLAGVHRSTFYHFVGKYGFPTKDGNYRNSGNDAWQSLNRDQDGCAPPNP